MVLVILVTNKRLLEQRRSRDGYVSATGMFKIAFPWAKHTEELSERDFLKTREGTSEDEVAGNVWISPALGKTTR